LKQEKNVYVSKNYEKSRVIVQVNKSQKDNVVKVRKKQNSKKKKVTLIELVNFTLG